MALFEVANHVGTVWLAVKQYNFPIWFFIKDVYGPFVLMTAVSGFLVYGAIISGLTEIEPIFEIIVWGIVLESLMMISTAFIVFTGEERNRIMNMVCSWLRR